MLETRCETAMGTLRVILEPLYAINLWRVTAERSKRVKALKLCREQEFTNFQSHDQEKAFTEQSCKGKIFG